MIYFLIEIGVERVGIVGSVCWFWTLKSFAKTKNKEDQRGLARCLSNA